MRNPDIVHELEDLLATELLRIGQVTDKRISEKHLQVSVDALLWSCSNKDSEKRALSLIRREDFLDLVRRYVQYPSKQASAVPLDVCLYASSSWKPLHVAPVSQPARHSETRPEHPAAVEELLRTIRRVFTVGDHSFTQSEISREIQTSKELGILAPSLIRFSLRRIRILHRFSKLSSLLGILRLLNAVIVNTRMNIIPFFPEILAGLFSIIAGPNVLQSSSVTSQEYARRAAGLVALRLIDRLGQPHSQAILGRVGKDLVEIASVSKDPTHIHGIRHFLEHAGLEMF
jgi:hypothetical protein